ncbi:nonribosomal peptide synthetase 11 [Grosmannia clavigera kw1407]|uniref:Nonribosomal peptide synthetase 11 n=1 Tax=Grosmannia clavigera (strain kw1407 / UAMH 11150) TaxID=655863 RepID=F0XV85_GROCL|nr:nonribosomal peptide synthetase 11 [Grosmannia clavigera kw1407]EFW98834.1 nonribosomal peptide synthetase 11 [Grosmannia clavigera kw1407]
MDSVVAKEHLTAPLTPYQLEMLSKTKEDPSRNYSFYGLTRSNVNGTIMADQLHEVWETLFYRHDIYRSTFDLDAKTQTVHAKPDFIWKSFEVLDETDMESVSRRERESL